MTYNVKNRSLTEDEEKKIYDVLAINMFSYAAALVSSTRYLIREGKMNPYFDTTVYVNKRKVALVLVGYRDDTIEYMRQLVDMTCVDHIDRVHRFNLWYTGLSTTYQKRFNLLTSVLDKIPTVTATAVYKSLEWAEREAGDMFGVQFTGHRDLRRILTDYGFRSFPLRKNFPTVGYGEKFYDKNHQAVVQRLVTLMQTTKTVNPFYDFRVKGMGMDVIYEEDLIEPEDYSSTSWQGSWLRF